MVSRRRGRLENTPTKDASDARIVAEALRQVKIDFWELELLKDFTVSNEPGSPAPGPIFILSFPVGCKLNNQDSYPGQ
jgi:hypothetical protein